MVLPVTCALIVRDGQVLVTQRSVIMSLPLKWEFPGGKVEPGESPRDCIVRELKEELGLETQIVAGAPAVLHPPENPHLKLLPFIVRIVGGRLHLLEHADARWCAPEDMEGLDWAAADIEIVAWWKAHHEKFQQIP